MKTTTQKYEMLKKYFRQPEDDGGPIWHDSNIEYIEKVCKLEKARFLGTNYDAPFIGISGVLPNIKDRIYQLECVKEIACIALNELARLGNGGRHGNSEGNIIAIEAIQKILKEN